MPYARHCPHCWGDCPGDCLLPGPAGEAGLCIHHPTQRPPLPILVRRLGKASFWRRVMWGVR
jgi:hypothetical protein